MAHTTLSHPPLIDSRLLLHHSLALTVYLGKEKRLTWLGERERERERVAKAANRLSALAKCCRCSCVGSIVRSISNHQHRVITASERTRARSQARRHSSTRRRRRWWWWQLQASIIHLLPARKQTHIYRQPKRCALRLRLLLLLLLLLLDE